MKPNGFVNRQKMAPPPLPNILFSGSPRPTPTSPSMRRKGKGKVVEGDGDKDLWGRSILLKCTFFSLYSLSCVHFCDFAIRISN